MDNQIIKENWFETMTRKAEESFDSLTRSIVKKPVKKIQVEIWEEIDPTFYCLGEIEQSKKYSWITNQGGKTYLVVKKENSYE